MAINGTTVLQNFDIIAAAGAANKAIVEQFNATADATGQIVIHFLNGSANYAKISGIEVIPGATATPTSVQIDSGGFAAGTFVTDTYFSGGVTAASTNTIDTSGVTNPAPQAVYQSERYGAFTYTVPNLAAESQYVVRLHFAEFHYTTSGKRIFNVAINGTTVLQNFDIVAAAGAANKAVVRQFTVTADASGQIVITFMNGSADYAKISGIEVK
ncbi:MAG TPA: malectin domain-containing carbohydrate-binding protein [Bryobacteraceae bacterium]|nr:malectin domain-containing carbohydrate-binding protein [Bryobacteraceae bacterium]